jgi:hypothetical protein
MLLSKNEDLILNLKFDEILAFLNTRLFERYQVSDVFAKIYVIFTYFLPQDKIIEEGDEKKITYKVDEFVTDAVALKITPFMLDSYAHEYEDMIVRDTALCYPVALLMLFNSA